jgi:heme-degrading monooxygenase HmoA
MYGTIARMQIVPGAEETLRQMSAQEMDIPGFRFQHVFRSDADPQELFLVVAFESKAAYQANAESPAQHARYEQFRALLAADPEWHDGEIVDSYPRD